MSAARMPATIEITSGRVAAATGASAPTTLASCCGLTASSQIAASRAAAALSVCTASPGKRSASQASCSGAGSATAMFVAGAPRATQPPTSERAICPPPMTAMRGQFSLRCVMSHPGSEQGGANAYVRGTFVDCTLEVAAHAHRQHVQRQAVGAQRLEQPAELREMASLHCNVVAFRRDAHQAAEAQAGEPDDGVRQDGQVGRSHSALGVLVAKLDLQADLQRWGIGRSLRGESFGDL
jgi:hypothetical protein